MKIFTADMMRRADNSAIEKYGIDGIILMENAASAVEARVCELADGSDIEILVLCGKGNNGGDGFAVARKLMQYPQFSVSAVFFGDENTLKGDCKKNYEIYKNLGGMLIDDINEFEEKTNCCDILVDALYGFDFSGKLGEFDEKVANIVNESYAYVIAVDVPSGINADTGECGVCIEANETVTFTGYKPAHMEFDAAGMCGMVYVANIGIPGACVDEYAGETIERDFVEINLPERKLNAHKGACGKVFVVGGKTGMSGAVCMSALSALKSGAGLVSAGVPASINEIFETKVTEAMSVVLPEDECGGICGDAYNVVAEYANSYDVLVIGPGMGRGDGACDVVLKCIKNYEKRLVLDADALYALAKDVSVLDEAKGDIVITPHYAEMARLTELDIKYIENNAIECAKKFSEEHNVTVVLKGAYTVIAGGGKVYVNNETGNAGMATGGSGDVLSGVIGALLCSDLDSVSAASCGVYMHGLAGDCAREKFGENAMCATDILESIADAFIIMQEI